MAALEGKVAFVTGAARGQGRSHAVRFAAEGADVIAVDRCAPIASVAYPLATPADLDETVRLVEATGRRMFARRVDVRDADELATAVAEGVEHLGRLDVVVANAGIIPVKAPGVDERAAWRDAIDVMLTGTWNTLRATVPILVGQDQGGAVVLVSSTSGLKGFNDLWGGFDGYTAAKHGMVGLMRSYAKVLAPRGIRVNSVHPTGVHTPMVVNEAFARYMGDNPEVASGLQNPMPVPLLDPADVTAAVLWLVSDAARYVTGVTLPIDAGFSMP